MEITQVRLKALLRGAYNGGVRDATNHFKATRELPQPAPNFTKWYKNFQFRRGNEYE